MDNTQQFNKHGVAFFFLQDAFTSGGVTTNFPWCDLGAIEERTAKNDPKAESLTDDREGVEQLIGEAQNAFMPSWELTTPNSSEQILAFYFRALPPSALARTGGAVTGVPITLWPGSPAKFVDANGNPADMIASVQSLLISSGTMAKGVDYNYSQGDLDRGFLYVLNTSTMVTGSVSMTGTISYTTTTYASNNLITQLSGPQVITGYGEIHLGSNQGQRRIVIKDRFSITVPDLTLAKEKQTRVKPTVKRLYAPTASTPSEVLLSKGY